MKAILRESSKCTFLIFLLASSICLANGGPLDDSAIVSSGNVEFQHMEDVRLESENLYLSVRENFVDVTAVYRLENLGASREVTYAFPVELSLYATDYFPRSENASWLEEEIPFFRVLENWVPQETRAYTLEEDYDVTGFEGWEIPVLKRIYETDLDLMEGETTVLVVQYRVKAFYEDFITSKSFFPSVSDRWLRYVLAPSGYWGDGIAGRFSYYIDLSWVHDRHGEATNLPPGEWISDDVFGFTATDFSMAEAEALELGYSIDLFEMSEYVRESLIPRACVSSLTASSVLTLDEERSYPLENMFDMDFATCWAEGEAGSGEGAWIELELEDFALGYIGILNGYTKTRGLYEQNARAREISYLIEFDEDDFSYSDVEEGVVELDDLPWEPIDQFSFFPRMQTIFETGMPMGVERIRISIDKVHPGSAYDDLCISELIILGNRYGHWQRW